MKILAILLLTLSSAACADDNTTINNMCDDCDDAYSYEYRSEAGTYGWYEVEVCDNDVNRDGVFNNSDLYWMNARMLRSASIPQRKNAVGDLNEDGVVSAADFCQMWDDAIDAGVFIPLSEDCPVTYPAP